MKVDVDKKLTKTEIEKIVGEPIKKFSLSSGANKGDNVAGSLLAIKVITEAASSDEEPIHLVYKSFPPTDDPQQLEFIIGFGIFRTELCMYEKVFPRITELLHKRPNVSNKSLPIVKFISGFTNNKDDYICMEDVRPKGFVMQDKFHSLTKAEVELVMKELGRFHALTNYLLRYDGERMFDEDDQLRGIKYHPLTQQNPMAEMFAKIFQAYMEATVELLEPRNKELADHMKKFVNKTNHHRIETLQRFKMEQTDKTTFPCIIHGDLWTNNILFSYSEEGNRNTPKDVKFIDFQLSRRSNIFEDLGYFFWTSTTPAFRQEHLIKMLGVYYDSFSSMMKELDFPKPHGFTKGSLIDMFNEGILSSFLYMPFALSLQLGDLTYTGPEDEKEKSKPDNNNGTNNGNNNIPEIKIHEAGAEDAPAPAFDMEKMIKKDKKMMIGRMTRSPRALERLEDLTREIVELDLLH